MIAIGAKLAGCQDGNSDVPGHENPGSIKWVMSASGSPPTESMTMPNVLKTSVGGLALCSKPVHAHPAIATWYNN